MSFDNKGLMLLTETEAGSMLSYKRLDKLETATYKDIFTKVNPEKTLGKNALDMAWFGSYLSSFGSGIKENDLDVLLSTDNPNVVFSLDPKTLTVKNEVTPPAPAQKIFITQCFQQHPWAGHQAYFIGDEHEYVYTTSASVQQSDVDRAYTLANHATSFLTKDGEMLRIYYSRTHKKFCYHSAVLMGAMEGDNTMDEPIFLGAGAGSYLADESNRYSPTKVIAVTNKNGTTKAFRIAPITMWSDYEEIEAKVETTGKILPESAIAVHPTEPILYYSNGNTLNSLNLNTKEFTTLHTFDKNLTIRSIAMNVFAPTTLFIGADNNDESSDMKASLYIMKIDGGSAQVTYFEEKVGGKVRQLIYKGDGTENVK